MSSNRIGILLCFLLLIIVLFKNMILYDGDGGDKIINREASSVASWPLDNQEEGLKNEEPNTPTLKKKSVVDEFCNGPDIPAFIDKNVTGSHTLKLIPGYKISVCHNPKSGSMAVARGVSHLAYPNNTDFGQEIRTDHYMNHKGSFYFNHMLHLPYPPKDAAQKNTEWTNIFVARDPITRIISAFADMCLGFKFCMDWHKDDFTLFIVNLYQALLDHSRKEKVHENIRFPRLYHFWPQTWFCSGFLTESSFSQFSVVKQDSPTFIKDFSKVLNHGGMEENKLPEFEKVMKFKSHSTGSKFKGERERLQKKLRSNPIIWKCLMKIVRSDAKLLNYKIEEPNFDHFVD